MIYTKAELNCKRRYEIKMETIWLIIQFYQIINYRKLNKLKIKFNNLNAKRIEFDRFFI
jgi:hypothetical protein